MKIKWIALLLALAMVAGMLVGCNTGTETTKKDTSNTPSGEKIPDGLVVLANDGESDYSIIYPQSKQTWAQGYAEELSAAIAEKTGVELPVKHDSERGANEYEIRIADVKGSRVEVLDVYREFGGNNIGEMDFAIKVVGKTVYIYGLGSQGVASGIDYFLNKVLAFGTTLRYAGIAEDFVVSYTKDNDPPVTITKTDDEYYVEFSLGAGQVVETFCRLSYTGNGGWRLQTKNRASEEFDDFGAAQRLSYSLGEVDPSKIYPVTVTVEDNVVTVREEGGSFAQIATDKVEINFYSPSGKLASTVTDIYANVGGCYLAGKLADGEAVFGTGERFNTSNQRGNSISLISRDIWSAAHASYVSIPLLTLSRGSGIFMNRYEAMDLDLGKAVDDEWSISVKQTPVDCYIFATDELSEVLYGYSALTGFAGQPEEWSYGMLMCRFNPDLKGKWSADVSWDTDKFGTSAGGTATADGRGVGVYDVIAKMEAYDLPWTGVLAEPWGPYSSAKMDDLKELCDYVHSLGKKFLLYIAVGGGGMGSIAESYVVTQTAPDGSPIYKLPDTQDIEGGNPDNEGAFRYYLDITNPASVEWFFNEVWYKLSVEIGVDGCKIDFCELMPESPELNYYDDQIESAGSHHWYPSAFCAKFWEMISSKPDSGMCYIRGGGIGLQRSPYVWGGDQKREFKSLQYQLTCVLSSGLSGLPFISYDMSGYEYMGGRALNEKTQTFSFTLDPGRTLAYESQVFIRGLQFTTFTICMQTHGTVRWAYEFAEDGDILYELKDGVYKPKTDASGNIIYDYVYVRDAKTGKILTDASGNKLVVKDENGTPVRATPGTYAYVTDIYRAYVKLHELLTPYITEYSAIASNTGTPVMRHLVLGWQDDANVYNIEDEYTFGDAFLVAPVLDGGYSRDIYLPEGEWLDLNTGLTHIVGAEGLWLEDYAVSVTTLPVFYNVNTTSETAAGLIPGIQEIFGHLDEIEAGIPSYLLGALQ
ncbi:MAG: hypothetical protein IJW29_06490 [Clostridia bacterium]|nr:hypothetical protein [Clostridia bacterium]